jgi:two-component sensor histidine kinase
MRPTPSNVFDAAKAFPCDEALSQRRDDSLELVVGELQHRIRNLFSVVQCLVANTDAGTADGYRNALAARIACLSEAYALIDSTREHRVSLQRLIERTLKPHTERPNSRVILSGPDFTLKPQSALSLHMIFHELATNASKHGALKFASGTVEVFWAVLPRPNGRTLALQWRERGGPEVTKPKNKGFGMRLIAGAPRVSHVDMDFASDGLVCGLMLDIEQP